MLQLVGVFVPTPPTYRGFALEPHWGTCVDHLWNSPPRSYGFPKMLPPSTFDRRTSLGESRVRAVVALTYNVVETVPLAYRMAPLTCHTSVRTSLSGQSHTLSPFKSQSLIMRLRTTHIKESLYDLQSKILSCYICGVEQFVDMEWTRLCYVVSSFE